jgi:hypothetical protein
MRTSEVKKLPPNSRWLYWIKERESIRLKKEAGKPKPWTDDEILQSYRFCNVRRMDDKVSQWLLHNWYEPHFDHPNMLLACALARFINKPETLRALTHIVFPQDRARTHWKPKRIVETLRSLKEGGNTIFTSAYMVRGMGGVDKIDSVVNYYVQPLVGIKFSTTTMRRVWEKLLPKYGMGSFVAGQIVADLRWAVTGAWIDAPYWAPIGPGSHRGVNRILGRKLKQPMSQLEFLDLLHDLIEFGTERLQASIVKRLEGIDWQNTLCEFDKYERALWQEGKPKQKYIGI